MLHQSFTIKILKIICMVLGITFKKNFTGRVVQIFTYFVLFILCPFNFHTQWRAILTYDTFVYKIDGFVYFCASSNICLMLVFAQLYSKKLSNIVKEIEGSSLFGERFFKICDQKIRDTVVPVFYIIIVLMFILGTASIAAVLFTNSELGSPPTLIYPAIHPWPVDTLPWYIFTICHESFSTSVAASVLVAQFLFLLCMKIIMTTLLEIEQVSFQRLHKKELQCNNSDLDVRLKRILHNHYAVLKFMENVKGACQPFFNITAIQVLTLNTFMTTTFVKVNNNNFYRLKMLSTQIAGNIPFTFFCFIGESISRLNASFTGQIYEVPWYNWPTTIQRNLAITMLIYQKPIQVIFFHIAEINWNFLGICIKRTYSAIQLLLNTQKP